MDDGRGPARGVGYENVGDEYLERRRLRRGAAGWVLLAGLGVAYVISGDFAGWNFGLAEGGWGGLFLATILMAVMYTAMVFSLAEMSSTIPTAGGGYGFARRALGPLGGFATGTAILIEYAIAPAAIATFIGAYVESLIGFGGPLVFLLAYVVFIGIHLYGVGEALKLMFVITAIAAVALLTFVVGMIPLFSVENLFDIAPTDAAGASAFLPFGFVGIWAALPYAIWFFLAIEGVPLAAEETRNPERDMPRGLIAGITTLLVFAALILVFGPGASGSAAIQESGNPLVEAVVAAYGGSNFLSGFINVVGLAGLIASFFSIIFAYSRQMFALSRAGYLPRVLSLTGRRRTPFVALVVPGIIGFLLSLSNDGALLINIAVFGATVSYALMMISHIVLRKKEPDLHRPYRTPGGTLTSGVALVLAVLAIIATFIVDPRAALIMVGVYALFLLYFGLYSRKHLVARAPEEEFAAIEQAESELVGSEQSATTSGRDA
ncbi:Ethanolamine permease [Rubrobacter radiotolerans]|uniref:Ethanolamine permease n=1 Tax=Rubrobacter radiotolerans TaxID=42256 RepID=A0A023X7M4_RUBRA|nr:ethanolamine permease [Rubrobacter radiotolerans]AHY48035.1 Ethanolamine permease [Rubrobacter radiotolerans]MDX5892674.1 ethanolamine permease [Rubrobacter radiotolerans]SMC08078.1 ethanolamine permease [Rubrobacter radiotolerans DSM 5868]